MLAAALGAGAWAYNAGIFSPGAIVRTPPAPVKISKAPVPEAKHTPPAPAKNIPANVEKPPQSPADNLMARAVAAFNSGDYYGTLALLSSSDDADALRGLTYYKVGQHTNAIIFLERAAAKNPEDFIALKALALAYYENNETEKSLNAARRAIDLGRKDESLEEFARKLEREAAIGHKQINESTGLFTVVYDGQEHGGRMALSLLDDAYREIGRETGYYPDGPITVVMYTGQDFRDVTHSPSWAGGMYDGKIRLPAKGMETHSAEALRQVVYHEYVHALVHSITTNCPAWLNEGLAEYFSEPRLNPPGRALPVAMLEDSFARLPSPAAGIAYRQSHAMVDHLISKFGLYRIMDMLEALGKGATKEEAFYDAFYIEYQSFAKEWEGSQGR